MSEAWKVLVGVAGLPSLLVGAGAATMKIRRWITEKHDAPVFRFLKERDRCARLMQNPTPVYPSAVTTEEIASALRRKASCVRRSLRRLETQNKVGEFRTGWVVPEGKPAWIYR
jgi:hypothetical protein